jgi:hypothetical protein
MREHKIVSREEWIAPRQELLEKEKASTRLRDQVGADLAEVAAVVIRDHPIGHRRPVAAILDSRPHSHYSFRLLSARGDLE